ncbi:hypothetical protein, partial [Xanthomonas phaseoli]
QEANDLFFGKALLHVQSPSVRELDSKLRCYSKSGGRRTAADASSASTAKVIFAFFMGISIFFA